MRLYTLFMRRLSLVILVAAGCGRVESPTTKTLRNIAGIPGGGIVAVGDSGVVLTHP